MAKTKPEKGMKTGTVELENIKRRLQIESQLFGAIKAKLELIMSHIMNVK